MFLQNSAHITVISQSGNCQYLSKILFNEIGFFNTRIQSKTKYLSIFKAPFYKL